MRKIFILFLSHPLPFLVCPSPSFPLSPSFSSFLSLSSLSPTFSSHLLLPSFSLYISFHSFLSTFLLLLFLTLSFSDQVVTSLKKTLLRKQQRRESVFKYSNFFVCKICFILCMLSKLLAI